MTAAVAIAIAGMAVAVPAALWWTMRSARPKTPRALETSEIYLHRVVRASADRQIGIVTGDLRRVRCAQVWVNPENTAMRMSRVEELSVSAIIRYEGARRDAAGRVTVDLIADELDRPLMSVSAATVESLDELPEKDGPMSAGAQQERAMKNRRYLPHEHSYVPREEYNRQWQVDVDCVNANDRELRRMEDHIMRTAVCRLIALREARAVREPDWMPDPRLVNPELRVRTTRDAMDKLARLLTGFACEARSAGWSWDELAGSATARHGFPNWTTSGADAFTSVTGQAHRVAEMRTLTWRCGTCNQQVTDRGPYGHPSDCESGHAADCARHAQEAGSG